jgi:hypothetical protein
VAGILAKELQRDEVWQQQQVSEFTAMAAQYVATPTLAGAV